MAAARGRAGISTEHQRQISLGDAIGLRRRCGRALPGPLPSTRPSGSVAWTSNPPAHRSSAD